MQELLNTIFIIGIIGVHFMILFNELKSMEERLTKLINRSNNKPDTTREDVERG